MSRRIQGGYASSRAASDGFSWILPDSPRFRRFCKLSVKSNLTNINRAPEQLEEIYWTSTGKTTFPQSVVFAISTQASGTSGTSEQSRRIACYWVDQPCIIRRHVNAPCRSYSYAGGRYRVLSLQHQALTKTCSLLHELTLLLRHNFPSVFVYLFVLFLLHHPSRYRAEDLQD